jgi:nitrogen fixation NifU-like protein
MADLRELYQQIILDHSRNPQNFGALADATHAAQGFNPLCGDKVTVFLRVNDGRVDAARFQGTGCAISQSSASLMTSAVIGKPVSAVAELFDSFHAMVSGAGDAPKSLGKLTALAGVREFPTRVKCATLCWHALKAALGKQGPEVSTE